MTGILPIRRKTQDNQSINQSINQGCNVEYVIWFTSETDMFIFLQVGKYIFKNPVSQVT